MSARTRPGIRGIGLRVGIGIGALALAVAVGLLVAAGLRGLSASQPTPAASASSAPPVAAAPAPVESAAPEPAPEPRPEAGRNQCVDDLGDGGVDIDSATVAMDDGDLAAKFNLAAPLPAGDSGLGLYVERSGNKAYQLGIAFVDGKADEVFVRDFDKSDSDTVDRYALTMRGTEITVVFPEESVKRLGSQWNWYAFATASGAAIDVCPGTEADPELLRFER